MDGDFRINLEELLRNIGNAEVISLYFPILGKTAYIIGFIDDNSRYITGLGVYRSQTSENVVEVYRLATGEF